MKQILCTTAGFLGGVAMYLFGGFTADLITLLIFMGIDFASGLIVAGVFKKSKKTESGALASAASFRGLCKKMMILLFVVIGYRLDIYLGVSFLRGAVIVGFIVNELLSIVENAGLMGLTSPAINNAIEILKKKIDENDKKS